MIVFMIRFEHNDLYLILNELSQKLKKLQSKQILQCVIKTDDIKKWVEIAQIFHCKLLMPQQLEDGYVALEFQKLDSNDSFHNSSDVEEKYGKNSHFANINKNQHPSFLYYFQQALQNINVDKRLRILNLGINSGEEFEVIKHCVSDFKNHKLVGIDYCQSAIDTAQDKFQNDPNVQLICHDINVLESLDLSEFDLIISIGTLQSASLEFKPLFMNIVQNFLKKDGAMILGFPNCRWMENEMIYGAKAPNYNFSEMSILFNDIIFCKKYLQQKKFRVMLTGKDYIFLSATSIRKCLK